MTQKSTKYWQDVWTEMRDNINKSTPVDLNETPAQKAKRINELEAHPEKWFKYYFELFYKSDPAPFHISSTKKVLSNPEYFIVRAWARGLSKSVRTMMEVLFLTVTGKKSNVIMVSATREDAERLLLPFKSVLESNNRIINDYGLQQSLGNWTASEFITRKGVAFRAIGAGQSPRGTRNDEKRPDVLLVDDIDTDEEVRNPERIRNKVDWVMEALYGTRDVSEPLLFIANGNIIGKFTTITELAKKANEFSIVNIRDKHGKSTWPAKNTEESIDIALSKISYRSAQKEYFNNPMKEGSVFKALNYGKVPKLKDCDKVVVYADPSTSNKDKSGGSASAKAVIIIGEKNLRYFIYWLRVDQGSNARFVDWLFEADEYLLKHEVQIRRIWIENNSLQDPFYEQVLKPMINDFSRRKKRRLNVSPDKRKKPEKFFRIEGTLEPIHRDGDLVFDEKLKETPDMERMEDQMLDVSPSSKNMDGPDALEGGVFKLQERTHQAETTYTFGKRTNFR